MNGRPVWVDRGWSWNLEFFFHYLDQVIAKVNHVFGESRFTVSKYPNDADQFFQVSENDQQYLGKMSAGRCFSQIFCFSSPKGRFPQNRISFL